MLAVVEYFVHLIGQVHSVCDKFLLRMRNVSMKTERSWFIVSYCLDMQ